MENEDQKQEYHSYNGMSRYPTLMGIPYMAGVGVIAISALSSSALLLYTGTRMWVWTAGFGLATVLFMRDICENDSRALDIFMLEIKWLYLKFVKGQTKRNGGTLTIVPIKYGRVTYKNAKHYFKKSNNE